MKRFALCFGILVCGLVLPCMGLAQSEPGPAPTGSVPGSFKGGRPGHGFLARLGAELQLTEAQRERIRTVVSEGRQAHKAARAEFSASHEELKKLIKAETLDEQAAAEVVKRISERRARLLLDRVRTMRAIYRVLDQEQREIFEASIARHLQPSGRGRRSLRAEGESREGSGELF